MEKSTWFSTGSFLCTGYCLQCWKVLCTLQEERSNHGSALYHMMYSKDLSNSGIAVLLLREQPTAFDFLKICFVGQNSYLTLLDKDPVAR